MKYRIWSLFNHKKVKQFIRNNYKDLKVIQRGEYIFVEGEKDIVHKAVSFISNRERLLLRREVITEFLDMKSATQEEKC